MKPYVTIRWDDTETDAFGWMCIFNLVNGFAGGGIRMHPTVTESEVIRLARGMAYKYKAIESISTGGCKGGIVYDSKKPDAYEVLKRYIIAMRPYIDLGLGIGGDLGTSYADVLQILKELDMPVPASKSQRESEVCRQGSVDTDKLLGETVDGFPMNDVITGYGVAYAADEAWKYNGSKQNARVVLQGFGCVGASCACLLHQMGYVIVGIADAKQLVVCADGLDPELLNRSKNKFGEMDPASFKPEYQTKNTSEWLDVECDILIPAALEDVINASNAHQVKAKIIVEAANIPVSDEGDAILKQRKIDVVPDFIVNMGAIRFFDRVLYCLIEPTVESALNDIEDITRRNVRKVFTEAEKAGRYQRDIALEIFQPTEQSVFEFYPLP